MNPSQILSSLHRAFRWHRRWFAAIFAVLAVAATLNALTAANSDLVAVVTTVRSVPGGTTLTAADLTVSRLPAAALPAGSFATPAEVIGQQVVLETPERSVITTAALMSSPSLVAAGRLALPLRFADSSTVRLLAVGNHIDVLGAGAPSAAGQPTAAQGAGDGGSYAVIASDVRVVAVPHANSSGVLSGGADQLVMVEVEPAQATAIAAAAQAGSLSYALR